MRCSTVITALAFVMAIPTLASAHGEVPFSDTTVIHGCRSGSGILRQITSGACVGSEVIVHWAIAGPAGTNGTNGTNGIAGTNGTNGIDGTSVALPDPPCFDNVNRYVDCGNGTVTDTVTGLIWLQQADCLAYESYSAANQAAAALKDGDCGGNLTDKSSPGDWRLPTRDEWSATIARAVALGCTSGSAPLLTDDAGTSCLPSGGGSSFVGVALALYWSSSTVETFPSNAWAVLLVSDALLAIVVKDAVGGVGFPIRAWPVRGGPR